MEYPWINILSFSGTNIQQGLKTSLCTIVALEPPKKGSNRSVYCCRRSSGEKGSEVFQVFKSGNVVSVEAQPVRDTRRL